MLDNKWSKFISIRCLDGKNNKVIVDICGEIINRIPTKEELKGLKLEISRRQLDKLSEEDKKKYLLEFLRYFNETEGRVPEERDFNNNSKYPSYATYIKYFESWNNAIIEAGFHTKWGGNKGDLYTKEELLMYLIEFFYKEGEVPKIKDFTHNSKYPGYAMYYRMFGSWESALKLVGLDIDSTIRKGVVVTKQQKARLAEIFVKEHFAKKDKVVDLSGKNCNSPYDGICPNDMQYDVKSSKLYKYGYWKFNIHNIYKEEINWYYLLAFNENYSEMIHAWRLPAIYFIEDIEKGWIYIGKYNIESMKQYEITERFVPLFENWLNQIPTTIDNAKNKNRRFVNSAI